MPNIRFLSQSQTNIAPPILLILLVLITRIPLQSHWLYLWDSVNFAFGVRHFNVAAGQPQAPGYLCYILLGRLATAATGSAQKGFTLLAIIASCLAAWAMFALGRRLWNPRVGWYAALVLIFSPVFWFYGEIALPHTLDALMVIVAANLSWRVWHGEKNLTPLLGLWLGIAGGLRQQTLVFMLPLALVAVSRVPWRIFLVSAIILIVTTLAWLVPLLHASGGWSKYWQMIGEYSKRFDDPTSLFLGAGVKGLYFNLSRLFRYTLWAIAFTLIPFAVGLAVLRPRSSEPWLLNKRVIFLLLWATPSLVFYVLIHMGQEGLIFVYLPICCLIIARAADSLAREWVFGKAIMPICLAANAAMYLFAPTYLLPNHQLKVLTEATIRDHDRYLRGEMAAVKAGMPPGADMLTMVWRFPQYYLPQTPLIAITALQPQARPLVVAPDAPPVPDYVKASALVWVNPGIDAKNLDKSATVTLAPVDGAGLRILRRPAGSHFVVSSTGFGLAPDAELVKAAPLSHK